MKVQPTFTDQGIRDMLRDGKLREYIEEEFVGEKGGVIWCGRVEGKGVKGC